jgi:hypothetical protein
MKDLEEEQKKKKKQESNTSMSKTSKEYSSVEYENRVC